MNHRSRSSLIPMTRPPPPASPVPRGLVVSGPYSAGLWSQLSQLTTIWSVRGALLCICWLLGERVGSGPTGCGVVGPDQASGERMALTTAVAAFTEPSATAADAEGIDWDALGGQKPGGKTRHLSPESGGSEGDTAGGRNNRSVKFDV